MKKTLLSLILTIISILFLILLFGCNQIVNVSTTTTTSTTTTSLSSTNIIRLYYIYPTNPTTGGGKKDYSSQNIGSAYSSDGINFTNDSGARLTGAYLTDPDVFKLAANSWISFYSKATSTDPTAQSSLYKATCTTPSGTFTEDNSFLGTNGNISTTIKIGSLWYVYGVTGNGIAISTYDPASGTLNYIGIAVSGSVADPTVIQLSNGSYCMYYKSSGNIYYTNSADGITWNPTGTLLISSGEVPGAIYVNGTIYLYYVCSDQSDPNSGKIVVKISTDDGVTFSNAQVVTGLNEASCDPDPVLYE